MDGKSTTIEMNSNNKKTFQKLLKSRKIVFLLFTIPLISICFAVVFGVLAIFSEKKQQQTFAKCEMNSVIDFNANTKQVLQGSFREANHQCFIFTAILGQTIEIDSKLEFYLSKSNQKITSGQGLVTEPILDTGEYVIHVNKNSEANNFELKVRLLSKDLSGNKSIKDAVVVKNVPTMKENSKQYTTSSIPVNSQDWSYNVLTQPPFEKSGNTQEIVDRILDLARRKGLPSNRLSISLVDLSDSRCCLYGAYADKESRFPASISKLFWIVAFFGELSAGKRGWDGISESDLYKMIQNSDNEPASSVLDWLTDTESGDNLSKDELNAWRGRRDSVNSFFRKAGYQYVNVSQKNFPIPKLKLLKPEGRELQMRGSQSNPLRNYLTTYETARLLYEIATKQSVSVVYSQKMLDLLRRNYEQEKLKEYDSIKGFFGERFSPSEIDLYSKAGWTSDSRQDAAIVISRDGKLKYILVMFGDDPAFANDWDFFPDASRIVYENMRR
jgi:hypothetical protein